MKTENTFHTVYIKDAYCSETGTPAKLIHTLQIATNDAGEKVYKMDYQREYRRELEFAFEGTDAHLDMDALEEAIEFINPDIDHSTATTFFRRNGEQMNEDAKSRIFKTDNGKRVMESTSPTTFLIQID